jgi:very-short-patch-repair endonuclease
MAIGIRRYPSKTALANEARTNHGYSSLVSYLIRFGLPLTLSRSTQRFPLGIAASAEALIETLLSAETPPQLASSALQGLVSVEPIEDRILSTIIMARQLSPLLRSPYEGLIYYMLETREATRGRFHTNKRLGKPVGNGSYELDLVADDVKLVIEIDGAQHKAPLQVKRDEAKQRDLEALGYRVRRFSTVQVSTDPVGVWTLIAEQLQSMPVNV